MRTVIFLDLDGVLNTGWWYSQMDRKTPKDKYGYAFDPNAVANLKRIIDETGAEIVISSSWKSFGLSGLQAMWKDRGLPGKVVDITPDIMSDEMLLNVDLNNKDMLYNRGCEVKGWLSKHGDEVVSYVIIDDMDDVLPEQQPHFVWTDEKVGLTEGNAVQAIMILNHLQCKQ